MKIEKAIRKSLPAHICLYGESSSGKTFTALKLAHGLINKGEKVCVIDTENYRASHYDVDFDFDVINFEAPFSPENYIKAINMIQDNGYKAIIIDSMTHEWDSIGGVMDQAYNKKDKNGKKVEGLLAWQGPKKEHKKLMDCILSSKAHVICCAKAKDKLKQVKTDSGKTEIVSKGFLPIQEGTFMYDMLINIKMLRNGTFQIMKCPRHLYADLKITDTTKYLDEKHGKIIAEWIKQGESLDMDFLKLQREARLVAMEGEAIFKTWFAKLSIEKQNLFSNTFKKELVEIYKNVDTDSAGEEVAIEKVSKLFTPAKAPVEPVKPVEPVAKTDETLVEQVKKLGAEDQRDIDYIKSLISQGIVTNINQVKNVILNNSIIKNKQLAEPKHLEKFKQFLPKSVDNYNLLN